MEMNEKEQRRNDMSIELKNIHKTYNSKSGKTEVFSETSLSVADGEQVIITGESGSGKSTLLNLIGLIDSDFQGEYVLNGKAVSQLNAKEKARLRNETFGFIFQEYALVEEDTVFDNVKIPLLYSSTRKKDYRAKVMEILTFLEMDRYMNKKVRELSGGQRQRVAIARALVNRPGIVLADEPTGSLDERMTNQVMELIYDYIGDTKTLLLVTHDLEKIRRDGQRILTIHNRSLIPVK